MKKHIRLVLIILILIVGIFSINKIKNVKADSGWDSSYDSGGYSGGSSYDSGSSWSFDDYDSYSSSSHDYSNSGSGISTEALFVLILTIIMLIAAYRSYRRDKYINSINDETKFKDISIEELNKYIKDKTIVELKEEFYEKFVKIQEAWMNFDYESLKKLCNNEIYNTYYEELEALKIKDGKNIMKDFNIIDNKIIAIKENDGLITIDYYLKVNFFDYVINSKTEERIKGSQLYRVKNSYILQFTISNKVVENCPNCGASIEPGTTKCSHCKAVIVQDSNEFVMSSKRRI